MRRRRRRSLSTPIESVSFAELAAARQEVRRVRVEPAMFDYLLAVVRRTREWPAVSLGAARALRPDC